MCNRVPVPVPEGYTLLKEGQATILQHGNEVFYNPAQVSVLSHSGPFIHACKQASIHPSTTGVTCTMSSQILKGRRFIA